MSLTQQEANLIYVIHSKGIVYGRTFLQKFFFLLREEFKTDSFDDFQPYLYGPFSRGLNNLISSLIGKGMIEESKINDCYVYKITPVAKNAISHKKMINDKTMTAFEKYKDYSAREIVTHVYRTFPNWTENSIIRDKI